jgi:hypothetical protein
MLRCLQALGEWTTIGVICRDLWKDEATFESLERSATTAPARTLNSTCRLL